MELNEQDLKDSVKLSTDTNKKLETAIKTQVYMLRNMLDAFEKLVANSQKKDMSGSGINDTLSANTKNSAKTMIKLYKESSMADASSDDLLKKFSSYQTILDAFKHQIEYGFDVKIIEEQQETVLDLISSAVK